jgi:dihydroorotate dehydrogenase
MYEELFRSRLGIGAGLIKYPSHVPTGVCGLLDHITFGSYTKEPREGNKEPNYWFDQATRSSINAIGLTNPGFAHFCQNLEALKSSLGDDCKLRVSLAPLQPGDIAAMLSDHASILKKGFINEIEINAACPNHRDLSGALHPVLCCDQSALDDLMAEAKCYRGAKAIKIAPDMTVEQLKAVVALANKHGFTSIVSGNTRKSSSVIDDVQRLSVEQGGLAGAALLKAGLSQVITLRKLINDNWRQTGDKFRLIGCGGVMSASDLAAYLAAGANTVQCVTYFAEYGEKGIQDLISLFASVD